MKKLILLLTICAMPPFLKAQTFMYGLGFSAIKTTQPQFYHVNSVAITNSFRYSFVEKENISFSFDLPVSVGISSTYDKSNEKSTGFTLALPVIVNFNHGAGSKRISSGRFGYFGGFGFSYNYSDFNADTDSAQFSPQKPQGGGPVIDAGVRFTVGRQLRQTVEFRFAYVRKLVDFTNSVSSLGCLYNF